MSKSVLLLYIIIADVTRVKREVKIEKKHIKTQYWAELIRRRLNSAAPPECQDKIKESNINKYNTIAIILK